MHDALPGHFPRRLLPSHLSQQSLSGQERATSVRRLRRAHQHHHLRADRLSGGREDGEAPGAGGPDAHGARTQLARQPDRGRRAALDGDGLLCARVTRLYPRFHGDADF